MRMFTFFISVILFSCNQHSIKESAAVNTEKIQAEVEAVIAQIFDAAAKVDSAKIFELFSFDDPGFAYMENTGVFYDVAAYKQMVRSFYGPLKSEILNKGTEKFILISIDNVLWSYSGVLTATYRDGKQDIYEPFGMTMLFRKKRDKWKVVFLQESTQPPSVKIQ